MTYIQIRLAISKEREKQLLETLKKESDAAVARHLQFIDTLIKDKEELSNKCQVILDQKTVDS